MAARPRSSCSRQRGANSLESAARTALATAHDVAFVRRPSPPDPREAVRLLAGVEVLGATNVTVPRLDKLLRALRTDRLALVLFVLGVVAAAVSIGMDTIDPARLGVYGERLEQTFEHCVELLAGSLFFSSIGTRLLALLDVPTLEGVTAGDVAPRRTTARRPR